MERYLWALRDKAAIPPSSMSLFISQHRREGYWADVKRYASSLDLNKQRLVCLVNSRHKRVC